MVQLEYDKVKIEVPENWDDITLGFYETFCVEKPETARERVARVAKICKVDAELLLSWPAEVFNRIIDYVGFLFEESGAQPNPCIEIDGVKYVVPIEDELSLGAWVDADEVQKRGENVMSNVLAIVCRPVGETYAHKNNEQRQAMFAALPVSKVLGVLAFFLHCKVVSDRRTTAYTKLAEICGQLPRNIGPSLSRGGGIELSQIWRVIRYYVLMRLLSRRLRRFSRTYNIREIKTTLKQRSIS